MIRDDCKLEQIIFHSNFVEKLSVMCQVSIFTLKWVNIISKSIQFVLSFNKKYFVGAVKKTSLNQIKITVYAWNIPNQTKRVLSGPFSIRFCYCEFTIFWNTHFSSWVKINAAMAEEYHKHIWTERNSNSWEKNIEREREREQNWNISGNLFGLM